MSKVDNFINALIEQKKIIRKMIRIAPLLPAESETCRYSPSGGYIFMYIPHDTTLFKQYRDELLENGFVIWSQEWELNEDGYVYSPGTPSDYLMMGHPETGLHLTIFLEYRHRMASVKKGNIPVRV